MMIRRVKINKLSSVVPATCLLVAGFLCNTSMAANKGIKVRKLRCEYLKNPQGIDVKIPRMSWQVLESGKIARGLRQNSYHILVASSPEHLAKDKGDLWDSEVKSSQSIHVVYSGKPLLSRAQSFWKVRVQLSDGRQSQWSSPAKWTMGLLKPEDWTASWISMEPKEPKVTGNWIWAGKDAEPGATMLFRKVIDIPKGEHILANGFTLETDGKTVVHFKRPGQKRIKYSSDMKIRKRKRIKLGPGRNMFAIKVTDSKQPGLFASLDIQMANGKIRRIMESDSSWKVFPLKGRAPKKWNTPDFNDSAWENAAILSPAGKTPQGKFKKLKPHSMYESRESPMLRKTFKISKPIKEAQVSICGLGFYELFLNGSKVGDHIMDPALTRYDQRALYVTYDVADGLKKGANAFGVQLANGIYNQSHADAWDFEKAPWRAFPQMLLQLDIVYTDGTKERVVSDGSWKVSSGPIRWDQLRMGVMYDARLEQPGWSTAGFNDSAWKPALIREGVKGILTAQMSEPIRVMKKIKPISITGSKKSGYLFDFGQNISGYARLKLSGPAGRPIVMEYGGSGKLVYADPFQTDVYILKGEGEEVWEPGFTYHGFRKVKVFGLPEKPDKETLEARVLYTAFEDRGAFECSNPLLNKITRITKWSYIGNFVGIPTDCPHREKNGWSGDAQVASELGLLYYGSEAAYTRWMLDFQAIQREDGKLPCIVPSTGWGFDRLDGPAWEIAYIMIPWNIYLYRGDRSIFKTHYENYKRWFGWYRNHPTKNKEGIIDYGLGDWVPIKSRAPRDLTSTGYYYAAARRIAAIAKMLGKTDEEKEYSGLAEKIKKAFNKKFYHANTGLYGKGSQTATSCALYHGLVEPENCERVVKNLVESIKKKEFQLDVGFLGSKYILRALSENGYVDVAYAMAIKEETPGWAYIVNSGNTTLWEKFQRRGSDNHVFLGDIVAWFISYLAGIRYDPTNPGFQRFLIKPEVAGDLKWVKAYHDSPYGRIKSEWKREEREFSLKITVPVNSVAEVYVPTSRKDAVRESGKSAAKADGVKFLRMENDRAVFEVGSGAYHFTSSPFNK